MELYPRDELILPTGVAQPWEEKAAGEGFFGIGIYRGKTETNHGSLWRSAWQLGASFIFSIGARFKRTAGDTTNAHLNLPCYSYAEWNDFAPATPHSTSLVAVEMGGTPLREFAHPDRAIYILGSEDNGLCLTLTLTLTLTQTLTRTLNLIGGQRPPEVGPRGLPPHRCAPKRPVRVLQRRRRRGAHHARPLY